MLTKETYQANVAIEQLTRYGEVLADLVEFVRYMKPSEEKDFMFDPVIAHHLVIYEKLQQFADGEFENLMILMPPGAGKSVLCTVQFPLWFWARNPRYQILCASNTLALAEEFSRRRRSSAMSMEYQALGLHLTKEDIKLLENDRGGTMSAHGVGGAIVGRRANVIMLDDPVLGSEQAASDVQLDKMMLWYDQDFRSRKVHGGKELIVTTRWSRRDIAGRLLNRVERGEEDWEILRLPLVCDEQPDPVGRQIGDVLWPEEFDAKRVRHAKRDALVFQTMYQQIPYIQDGDWVGEGHIQIKHGTPDTENMKLMIGADLALTQGGKGDYTVFAVCGVHKNGNVHIVHIERNRHDPNESVKTLFKLCKRYPEAHELLLDDDGASKVFKELLLSELKNTREHIGIVPIMMPTKGQDKEVRASNLRQLFHQNRVIIWNNEATPILVKEIMGFPDGCRHDDQVDALALAAKRAVKFGGLFTEDTKANDPFEGMLMTDRKDEKGRMISNVSLNSLIGDKPQTLSLVRRRI